MKFNKEDYHRIIRLYSKQHWLINKEPFLNELISFYSRNESKELIYSLLERFHYPDLDYFNYLLNQIVDFIIKGSGFDHDKMQILSFTFDERPDSSQKLLDMIKMPLFKNGWHNPELVNTFRAFNKYFQRGKSQILMIDEFIGSGTTIRSRLRELSRSITGDYQVKFCFIAGIKNTIDELESEGIEIFCPLQLERGISDFYKDDELILMTEEMLFMESGLAPRINEKELTTFSFGYGRAEALYSLEGCSGNTPNSVFPIFWWIKDKNNCERNTLLTRFEFGF